MSKKELGMLGFGLGVGATIALLYAPKRGAVTRRYIRLKAHSAADYVKHQGEHLRDATLETVERGKRKVMNTKEQIAAAIQAGRQAYEEASRGTLG
jgi:gas vesicle protein